MPFKFTAPWDWSLTARAKSPRNIASFSAIESILIKSKITPDSVCLKYNFFKRLTLAHVTKIEQSGQPRRPAA
jgi:hypothetical protein